MATQKIRLTKNVKDDFSSFWSFCMDLERYARSQCEPNADGSERSLPLPNKMMVMTYAANVWFSKNEKKGDK